ncbi:putative uncharacterized protein [Mycolicibacterium canariasense]|uniref:DUF4232 domain-containing protein n=1 Tax=Mycolicibacterium canariasense TaxID=228230 RepID=A0A100WGT8_MYCCR|nr:DUF4232 domain-containing protein [Mycolicibacterium canariasense]MCV7212496.1 DUF4232 domain-containing protein [Mycolicibacterium canariasense]ORV15455.1 hypothetical protein AWB94_03510 [Mycolicibacterium canariasense]GAS97931.1 putative uncharacterized protein [Mycolicibacterium canariasense]
MKIVARSLPVVAVALLAGCTAQQSPPAQTVTVTATPTAHPTLAATPAPAPPVTPVTVTVAPTQAPPEPPQQVGPCSDEALDVTNGPMESANTQRRVVVSFRNSSQQACTMVGYPGADLVTPAGGVLINIPRRPANAAPRLTLQPGEVASADVLTSMIDTETGNACARWGQLVVTPPDDVVARTLPIDLPICGASISSVG